MSAPDNGTALPGQGQQAADRLNTYVQFCQNVSQLRGFAPLNGPQHVYLEGIGTPNDGGQGDFYWNATSTGPDDGVNTIMPLGLTVGAWVRLGGNGFEGAILCTASISGTVVTLTPVANQSSVANPPVAGQTFIAIITGVYSGPFTLGVGAQTPAPLYDTGAADSQGQTSGFIANQVCLFAWNPDAGAAGIFNLLNPAPSVSSGVPIGAEFDWPCGEAPSGYLLEYGQAISRTTYPVLNAIFAARSYPFGAGDGSTTFNLPDKRGRVVAGGDAMGGTPANRLTKSTAQGCGGVPGNHGGEQAHTMVLTELVSHQHSFTFFNGAVNSGTEAAPAVANTGMATGTTATSGSGAAFNVVQPTIVCHKIIRAG